MTVLTQVPPVQPAQSSATQPSATQPTQPLQMDAFHSAMTTAGAALGAGPDAIGKTLLSGIESFNANEAQFRATVTQAATPEAPQITTNADDTAPADPDTPRPLTMAETMREGDALQRQSMGVMMQTYSFALEATLVSNAASTFTGSVNTLIKTQ